MYKIEFGMSLGMHQDIHITERLTRIDDGT